MAKIAVIGGSYLQLPVVLKAKELGHEVHCFSWEEGAVCKNYADYYYPISIIEKELILDKCKEIGINGILTIASDIAVITVNYVAHFLGLTANPIETSKITTNKFAMRKALKNANLPIPHFQIANHKTQLEDLTLNYPLIVKPIDRSGSRGVEKVYNLNQLHTATNNAIKESFKNQAIIEEFITGNELSVESISFEGKHYIIQITDKVTTGEPYFVELEHHQPSQQPPEIQQKIISIVKKSLSALGIRYGASHTELKITNEGEIKIIEIGARMGGDFIGSDLVYLSTGYDFLKGVIDIALGNFTVPFKNWNKHSGVYFLCKESDYLLPFFTEKINVTEIIESKITDEELHNIHCSGDRSGYIIYQSERKFNPKGIE